MPDPKIENKEAPAKEKGRGRGHANHKVHRKAKYGAYKYRFISNAIKRVMRHLKKFSGDRAAAKHLQVLQKTA